MGESFIIESKACESRASEQWVAPFKKKLVQGQNVQDIGEGERDLWTLARSIFTDPNPKDGGSAARLRPLLEKLEADTDNRVQFRKLGCVPLLVHHMAKNASNIQLQIVCCHIFTSIADRDEETQKEIGERRGIEALLDLLLTFKNHPKVCRAAFASLRGLTLIEQNRIAMITGGVLEGSHYALRNFMEDQILVENAIATVARVVFGSNDARIAFGKLDGILLVTLVLQRYESCSSMQAEGALALRNLGFECIANNQLMEQANTMSVLFRGLRSHADNHLITNQMLAAVGNMVTMDCAAKNRIMQSRTYIAQLFRTLTLSAKDTCLCRKIIQTLLQLCKHDPCSDRSNSRTLSLCCTEDNGCAAIVTAVESAVEVDNPLLVKLTCLTLELCIEERFRQAIADSGALRILLKTLQAGEEKVLNNALLCVGAIISGNDENKRKFSKIGGFPSVMEVMSKHAKNEEVIENCCKVFDIGADGQTVTSSDLLRGKDDIVAAVVKSMKNFPKSISEEDSSHMVSTGVRDVVESARSMHTGNTAVESLANQLLSLLVTKTNIRRGRGDQVGSSGNSSSRLRSRSRTIGNRTRSRQGRSKSPIRGDRRLNAGRRTMLAAQRKPVSHEKRKEEVAQAIFDDLSARNAEREPKQEHSLEPISE